MNYELLWSIDEYQSLLNYKWNSFKYINMFLTEDITNREKRFNEKSKGFPQNPEEFKKAIETIVHLYEMIQKNYILNDGKEYYQKLYRGVRKNSKHAYFTSTTKSLEKAIFFINGDNNENIDNDILLEIEPSQVAWIDVESFISISKGGDLNEEEILFLPCEYQLLELKKLGDYISNPKVIENLSKEMHKRLTKIENLAFGRVKLVAVKHEISTHVSLDTLVERFEEYRQNLIKLSETIKFEQNISEISKQICEFKKLCSDYLYSQFYAIDMQLEKTIQRNQIQEKIHLAENSIMQEIHIGNTGRMLSIKSPEGIEEYYFKPAESKDRIAKPYRAYIQEAAYNVQRIINPSRTVKCNVYKINGIFGAIQEKVNVDENATKQFRNYFYGTGDKIDSKILSQILDEYLVDYCLCNYDAHARNFVIDSMGNLRGIDKEQSFRYINEDENDDMLFSQNYNNEYGESETIYATIFKKFLSGEISYEILEGLNYRAARLTQMPEEKYRNIFKDYAYSKTKTAEEAEALLDRIVYRKKSIIEKMDSIKQEIYEKSYGKTKGNDKYIFTDQQALQQVEKAESIDEKFRMKYDHTSIHDSERIAFEEMIRQQIILENMNYQKVEEEEMEEEYRGMSR